MLEKLSNRPDGRTWYVLARDRRQFEQWAREKGVKLQDCKFLDTVEKMIGLGFELLGRELVATVDWTGEWSKEMREAGAAVIARWCRDRRLQKMGYAYVV